MLGLLQPLCQRGRLPKALTSTTLSTLPISEEMEAHDADCELAGVDEDAEGGAPLAELERYMVIEFNAKNMPSPPVFVSVSVWATFSSSPS